MCKTLIMRGNLHIFTFGKESRSIDRTVALRSLWVSLESNRELQVFLTRLPRGREGPIEWLAIDSRFVVIDSLDPVFGNGAVDAHRTREPGAGDCRDSAVSRSVDALSLPDVI